MGADILIPFRGSFCGIQRKEYSDLLASLHDGRLQKERAQMKRLAIAMLIVEGKQQWTTDGVLMDKGFTQRQWTKDADRNLMRSVQSEGIWVERTDTLQETILAIQSMQVWLVKGHKSLSRRPGPPDRAVWGAADCREFQLWILQGIPGVGPVQAEAVLDHFGKLPLAWTVTAGELEKVPGVGKKKAARMVGALSGEL